jgi:Cof subfamily protein (haloacid dehalogenase superfamily)
LYKAVFIDVDGTLIKSDHSVSNTTFDVIQKLVTNKILVVLVSARPLSGIEPIAKDIGLLNNPIASLNGAYISDKGNIILNSIIDLGTVRDLDEQLQPFGSTIIYYQQNEWFSQFQNFNTDYEQKITSIPVLIQPVQLTLQCWQNNNNGPNKVLVITEEAATNNIQECLKQKFGEHLNTYTSKPTYIEIMNKEASKVNAVKLLIKRFNLRKEEIIAIGDNFNDKEMIEYAGLGIAMGNAPEEIKVIADYVTDTNNEDGVAKALLRILNV